MNYICYRTICDKLTQQRVKALFVVDDKLQIKNICLVRLGLFSKPTMNKIYSVTDVQLAHLTKNEKQLQEEVFYEQLPSQLRIITSQFNFLVRKGVIRFAEIKNY